MFEPAAPQKLSQIVDQMDALYASGLTAPDIRGQPAEETFEGAKNMIEHGILDGVDAALAFHVGAGPMPVGLFMYNSGGTMMYSVDGFRITVKGWGAHGAYPQNAIAPINIAVHIYLALLTLMKEHGLVQAA